MKLFILALSLFCVSTLAKAQNNKSKELDFMLGNWKAEAKIKVSPEDYIHGSGSIKSYYKGDTLLAEMNIHFEDFDVIGVTKRLYNPKKQQWGISWNPANNMGETVPHIEGTMRDDRFIEFNYGKDEYGPFIGRLIIFNISNDHFSVRKDRIYDSGGFRKDIWVYEATKIE